MEFLGMGRPRDKHIDDHELDALVPSSAKSENELHRFSADVVREVERHVDSCASCKGKVAKYRRLLNRPSNAAVSNAGSRTECSVGQDVDWHEVAAGMWPELKANQLIMHAAQCDDCGPRLRAAVDDEPTPEEERLLAELRAPSRPVVKATREPVRPRSSPSSAWRLVLQWKVFVPALALLLVVGIFATRSPSSQRPLSGSKFAEFAVSAHRQHAQGHLALDVRSDSPQVLNEWVQSKAQFSLALPASPAIPGEQRPYRMEGVRLMHVGGRSAAYVAYRMQSGLVSLIVAPDSVAVASGGVEVDFAKVNFHYATVGGYKAVTWSVHGLTYALISQEGNRTQRSCMVCHSAMKDRDLSETPTPLRAEGNLPEPVWQ
jgi:anti-sigma factor RsiW